MNRFTLKLNKLIVEFHDWLQMQPYITVLQVPAAGAELYSLSDGVNMVSVLLTDSITVVTTPNAVEAYDSLTDALEEIEKYFIVMSTL